MNYAWIPYVNLSQYPYHTYFPTCDTSSMLRIGFNTTDRDGWVATNNELKKCKFFYVPEIASEYTGYCVTNSSSSAACSVINYSPGSGYYKKYVDVVLNWGNLYYRNVYTATGNILISKSNPDIPVWSTLSEGLAACDDGNWDGPLPPVTSVPITYTPIGCELSGPSEAEEGETVSVLVTPDSGKIIRTPVQGQSISVYDKSGYIDFTYSNNTIQFTVPTSS